MWPRPNIKPRPPAPPQIKYFPAAMCVMVHGSVCSFLCVCVWDMCFTWFFRFWQPCFPIRGSSFSWRRKTVPCILASTIGGWTASRWRILILYRWCLLPSSVCKVRCFSRNWISVTRTIWFAWERGMNGWPLLIPPLHFEYLVLLFGLSNAPAVFQALVNDVFRDMLDQFIYVYLDDILIFSHSLQEHVQHIRQVLQRLLENGLYVKAEKCVFHAQSVPFLGYIVSAEGVCMDPDKVKAVVDWPIPNSRKALQRFLGFANFHQHFILNANSKF